MSSVPFVTYVPVITHIHEESMFLIQACGSRVAILFQQFTDDASPNGLVIWDWKSGQRKLVRLTASYCVWNIEGFPSSLKMQDFDLSALLQKTWFWSAWREVAICLPAWTSSESTIAVQKWCHI
jgi:hypothetical protein